MHLSLYLQKKNENKRKPSFLVLPLFINYLMKSGNKTRSIHILEKSIHLFSHIILKKKLPYITKSFLAFLPSPFFLKNNNYENFLEKNFKSTFKKYKYKTIYNFFYKEKYKKNLYLYFFPEGLKQKKTEKENRISFFLELSQKKKSNINLFLKDQNQKLCLWYKLYKKSFFPNSYTFAQKNTFLFYFYKAIENVKPPLECRSKRFGGTNRQIPATVSEHRQWGFAIRWIIEAAEILKNSKRKKEYNKRSKEELGFGEKQSILKKKQKSEKKYTKKNKKEIFWSLKKQEFKKKKEKTSKKNPLFSFFLAEALYQAYYNRGSAIEKRNLWIDSAISNRAFLRYRWW